MCKMNLHALRSYRRFDRNPDEVWMQRMFPGWSMRGCIMAYKRDDGPDKTSPEVVIGEMKPLRAILPGNTGLHIYMR